jgi:hypothetical protein
MMGMIGLLTLTMGKAAHLRECPINQGAASGSQAVSAVAEGSAPIRQARAAAAGARGRRRHKAIIGLEPATAAERIGEYWATAESEHAARRELAGYLVDRLSGKRSDMYEVVTTDIPARTVLCLKRNVAGEEGAWALGKEFVAILRQRHLTPMQGSFAVNQGSSEPAGCLGLVIKNRRRTGGLPASRRRSRDPCSPSSDLRQRGRLVAPLEPSLQCQPRIAFSGSRPQRPGLDERCELFAFVIDVVAIAGFNAKRRPLKALKQRTELLNLHHLIVE